MLRYSVGQYGLSSCSSLEPMPLDIKLGSALSLERIRVNIPAVFTVAVGSKESFHAKGLSTDCLSTDCWGFADACLAGCWLLLRPLLRQRCCSAAARCCSCLAQAHSCASLPLGG